mmetsp:Transcript_61172/g.145684  ORF Transcript_61172/g.145684 Transcript_61172/m.145684 type:complete len:196 (-) Transcript_61172:51-638(-)
MGGACCVPGDSAKAEPIQANFADEPDSTVVGQVKAPAEQDGPASGYYPVQKETTDTAPPPAQESKPPEPEPAPQEEAKPAPEPEPAPAPAPAEAAKEEPPAPQLEPGYMEVTIARQTLEERLGLDLKHCKTHLLVKKVQDGDAVDLYNKKQTDPSKTIVSQDTIWKVNGVEKEDVAMIKEIRSAQSLTLLVKKKE